MPLIMDKNFHNNYEKSPYNLFINCRKILKFYFCNKFIIFIQIFIFVLFLCVFFMPHHEEKGKIFDYLRKII